MRFYAERAESMLADEVIATSAAHSAIKYQPIGPVLAVMPWNFPLWQVVRFAARPHGGQRRVLKHASTCRSLPFCSKTSSGAPVPDGAFTTLLVGSGSVAKIIADGRSPR